MPKNTPPTPPSDAQSATSSDCASPSSPKTASAANQGTKKKRISPRQLRLAAAAIIAQQRQEPDMASSTSTSRPRAASPSPAQGRAKPPLPKHSLPKGWQGRVLSRKIQRAVRRGRSKRQIARLLRQAADRNVLSDDPSDTLTLPDTTKASHPNSRYDTAIGPTAPLLPQDYVAQCLRLAGQSDRPPNVPKTVPPALPGPLHQMIVTRYLDTALEAYGGRYREKMKKLALSSEAMCDLLKSFPGLLFGLAGGYGIPRQRKLACQVVLEGKSLKQAAKALGLPLWTRQLPPRAFQSRLGKLPDTAHFNRQISNFIPKNETELPKWLRTITLAYTRCDDGFALWLARYHGWIKKLPLTAHDVLTMLAAYAWYSQHRATRAGQIIRHPWSPQLGLRTALTHCKDWYERLLMEYHLGDGLQDVWLREGRRHDLQFTALRTVDDLCKEARQMRNCVRDYSAPLGRHDCRLFSVRQQNRPVATVEIRPHPLEPELLTPWQIRGPGNVYCSRELVTVIHAWFYAHKRQERTVPETLGSGRFHEDRWKQFWQPYLHDRGLTRQEERFAPNDKLPTKICRLC